MNIHPSASIHRTAIVEDGAIVEANVSVGPFAFIGSDVVLREGVAVKSHCVIKGWTEIGELTEIFPFAAIGDAPQDLKYRGERTRLIIGARNCIREGVTMNTGTTGGRGITRVGSDCLFMTGSHVGHDSIVGNRVIMANQAALGGHCVVEDFAVISGLSGVHQFARVGRSAFVGALTFVDRDVIPFTQVQGSPGKLRGVNLIGLRRRQITTKEIQEVKTAYRALFGPGELVFQQRISKLAAAGPHCDCVNRILEFVNENTKRKYMKP